MDKVCDDRRKGWSIKLVDKMFVEMLLKRGGGFGVAIRGEKVDTKGCRRHMSLEYYVGILFNQITLNNRKLDVHNQVGQFMADDATVWDGKLFNQLRELASVLEGYRADADRFLGNLRFARVGGGLPFCSIVGVSSPVKEESNVGESRQENTDRNLLQKKLADEPRISLSNVERVGSTLSTESLTVLIELLLQLGQPVIDHPDKKKILSLQDIFRCTKTAACRNPRPEAAAVVPIPPPDKLSPERILKSALAGGLSCAMSAALMHPVDTIKTRVQASTLTFPEILSKLPGLGIRRLYLGSFPAILGQFSSHGLRTGIFEASKFVLINFAPRLPEVQIQSVASFCGTVLGTAARIPCEVLKQRLQAGLFENVGEAISGTWHRDGLKGFFHGTGATILREVPFYVAGMALYAESQKVVQKLLHRELEPWETMAVGALSGGFTAVLTTPLDVIKTRMMTAQGRNLPYVLVAVSIVRGEGPLGLFKGAVPRFFWVAPLGAMNFAGYELIRKAMG